MTCSLCNSDLQVSKYYYDSYLTQTKMQLYFCKKNNSLMNELIDSYIEIEIVFSSKASHCNELLDCPIYIINRNYYSNVLNIFTGYVNETFNYGQISIKEKKHLATVPIIKQHVKVENIETIVNFS